MTADVASALFVFAASLSVATVLAALQELREGRWAWPTPGVHLAQGGVVAEATVAPVRAVHRSALVLRLVCPVLLAAGVVPRLAAVLTFIGLAVTLLLRLKHNTLFMAVGMGAIACGPTLTGGGGTSAVAAESAWTYATVAVLVLGLYVGGAITKMQSVQFRTGSTLLLIAVTRAPRLARTWESVSWRTWQGLAIVVIASEVLVVVLLAIPGGLGAAFVVGLALHSALATIQPGRLIPFQIATLGAYPAAAAGFALLW